ncbi:DNA cytosine methyltransferase [Agrobacterium sp. NPDC090283]|uniref:DNA cytosine methyltransferase n=1 Tax=Agrobacterium sp. NPDC090283 TaxID=3363920 RepID=UPI00383A9C08
MTAALNQKTKDSIESKEAAARLKRLASFKNSLLTGRSKITECLVKMGELADLVKADQHWTDERTKEWLKSEIGMSPREAATAVALKASLSDRAELIVKAGLQPDVIDRLIDSDASTRTDFLLRLQSGCLVDADLAQKLDREAVFSQLPAEEASAVRRTEALETAAEKAGPSLKAALEEEASRLLIALDQVEASLPSIECEETGAKSHLLSSVQSSAKVLRILFQILFGDQHPGLDSLIDVSLRDDVEASLAFSWYALQKLETESLYREDVERSGNRLRNVRPAIEFLAGVRPVAVPLATDRTPVFAADSSSTFIDFGAGIGSAALGLHSAGYRALALYESWLRAFETVSINRPSWRIQSEPAAWQLKQLANQDVDLVTCGPPLRTFSEPKGYHFSIYRRALAAIAAVHPKAFFFEVHPSMFEETSMLCRGSIERDFSDEGFDVKWHSLDTAHFGIAQSRPIGVIIGVRKGFQKPILPALADGRRRFLPEMIGDLVAHEAARIFGPAVGDERYSEWQTLCAGQAAPPFFKGKKDERNSEEWAKLGLGFESDPRTKAGELFPLTIKMIQKIQGHPRGWILQGAPVDQELNGTASMPPVVAKILGLAIHSALSGQQVDFAAALNEPLLPQIPAGYKLGNAYFGDRPRLVPIKPRRLRRATTHPAISMRENWARDFNLPNPYGSKDDDDD